MTNASYNDIAEWYDQYLRDRPVYREVLLPNLLDLVGEVEGEVICDLACGKGWIARELATWGVGHRSDLAPNLLALAQHHEEQEPLGIVYVEETPSVLNRSATDSLVAVSVSWHSSISPIFAQSSRAYDGFSSQEAGLCLPLLTLASIPRTLSGHLCLIQSMHSLGPSPAILTNASGIRTTPTESAAGWETITACSAPISTRSWPPVLFWNRSANHARLSGRLNWCLATAKSLPSC